MIVDTLALFQDLLDGFNLAEDDHERAIAGAQLCGAIEMLLLIARATEEEDDAIH